MMFYTYVILSEEDGKFYTGSTSVGVKIVVALATSFFKYVG